MDNTVKEIFKTHINNAKFLERFRKKSDYYDLKDYTEEVLTYLYDDYCDGMISFEIYKYLHKKISTAAMSNNILHHVTIVTAC